MRPLLLSFALLLTGCPTRSENGTKPAPAPPAACASVGQTCEFAPGKLGSCVRRDDCTGDACFVCQSQH